MFEGYTYERLLEEVLNNAPEEIDFAVTAASASFPY